MRKWRTEALEHLPLTIAFTLVSVLEIGQLRLTPLLCDKLFHISQGNIFLCLIRHFLLKTVMVMMCNMRSFALKVVLVLIA